jgi:hypothetical protein
MPRFQTNPRMEMTYLIAERLGKTHAELIGGSPEPLAAAEVAYWMAYWQRKQDREKAAYDAATRKGTRD